MARILNRRQRRQQREENAIPFPLFPSVQWIHSAAAHDVGDQAADELHAPALPGRLLAFLDFGLTGHALPARLDLPETNLVVAVVEGTDQRGDLATDRAPVVGLIPLRCQPGKAYNLHYAVFGGLQNGSDQP